MFELIVTVGMIGFAIYLFMFDGDVNNVKKLKIFKKFDAKNKAESNEEKSKANKVNFKSSKDALPFKDIKVMGNADDKALIRRENNIYVGVIQVGGVSWNMLSLDEKLNIEEMYQRLKNGLTYPIQLFIHSRSMNIDDYNVSYRKRIDEIKEKKKIEERKYNSLKNDAAANSEIIKETYDSLVRLTDQSNYGEMVIDFINAIAEDMSVIDKKYYIATPYYYDSSKFNEIQTEEEMFETAFNVISNRLESIRTTFRSQNMESKMLDRIELSELLYSSINKEDADKYKLINALYSGYSHFYSTGKPVEFKKLEHEENKLKDMMVGGY